MSELSIMHQQPGLRGDPEPSPPLRPKCVCARACARACVRVRVCMRRGDSWFIKRPLVSCKHSDLASLLWCGMECD